MKMMAVEAERFSIREYTAKMRAVDVKKCWPFSRGGGAPNGSEINKEQVEALLPPITITKFRWWSHELNRIQQLQEQDLVGISRNEAKEKESLEIVCPVCGNFMEASMKAVHAHVDTCLAHAERKERRKMRMPMKPKSKSKSNFPKKRSILEIFAVSLQIDKVDDENVHDKEDESPCSQENGVIKTKHQEQKKRKIKINKNKLKKALMASKLAMGQNKNKIKKKTKKKSKNNYYKGSTTNKGNAHKLQSSIPVNCSRKLKASFCNKEIVEDTSDGLYVHRNNSGLGGSVDKQHRVKASKYVAKHQKTAIPVRGILKNHTKLISHKDSDICDMPGGSQTICLEREHLDRHVTFSGKDDILGPRKKSCRFSEKFFSATRLNALACQLEQDRSAEIDKQSAAAGVHGSVDATVSTGNETVLQISKKQLMGIQHPIAMADFLRLHQENEQHIPAKSSPSRTMINENNSRMFAQGYQIAPNNPICAGILRLLPTVSEVCSHVNSQICANISMTSNSRGKTTDCYEDRTHEFAAVEAFGSTGPFTQASSPPGFALVENAKRKSSFTTQSSINSVIGQALPGQSYCPLSPTVAPELKQRTGGLSENCRDEEFCGLPLNSHGELNQLSSGGRVSFNQLKKSTMTSSSGYLFPRTLADIVGEKHPIEQDVQKGQLNLQTMHNSHNVHLPERFGVNELLDTGVVNAHSLNSERECNHSAYPLDLNPSLTNISFNHCRQYGQIQKQKGIQMTHLEKNSDNLSLKTARPTMRLMGKDVAISRSNIKMRGFEDGQFWMDKEIIREHCPVTNSLGNSLLNIPIQQGRIFCRTLEKSKETLPPPLRIENNQALLGNFPMKVQEPRSSHPFFNWNTTAAFQKGDFAVDRNADYQLHMSAPCPHLGRPYKGANLQESFISCTETLGIRSRLPMLSTSPVICPTMGWRPSEINYQQDLSSEWRSVLDFPFSRPDCSEHVSYSSFPSSSKNLPPWLLHATKQVKAASMPFQTFADANENHHPCNTTGTNFLTAVHHSPMHSYPHTSVIPNPLVRGSSGSALFVQPPVFPFSPGINSNSSMTMSYRNKIRIRDKMKSNAFGVNVLDHCQKINKRPAAGIIGDMLRPSKMPNFFQDDISTVIEVTSDNSSSEICQNIGAHELHTNWEKAIDAGRNLNKYQKDGMPKLGPIKPSAGAKLILKPSWNSDQDNSRLIHSTNPFAAVADDSVLDSQKKSTMIYRF